MKKLYAMMVVAAMSLFGLAQSAMAAVPTEITDLLTSTATDFATLLTGGLVLWAAIKGPMIVWRLASRVLGRGSSGK